MWFWFSDHDIQHATLITATSRPRPIAGMETALPDYSERLARRTGAIERVVAAKYDAERTSGNS